MLNQSHVFPQIIDQAMDIILPGMCEVLLLFLLLLFFDVEYIPILEIELMGYGCVLLGHPKHRSNYSKYLEWSTNFDTTCTLKLLVMY